MRYVQSRIKKESMDKAYRIYVTDCLKFVSENTAKQAGGTSYNKRYFDLIDVKPEETRSSDEVIESIQSKLKLLE